MERVTAAAPMMLASKRRMANRAPRTWLLALSRSATPRASVKWPKAAVPLAAELAVTMMAAAPNHHQGADHGVGSFVADEAGRDALVHDVGLLEEELPGGDGRPDDGDDEQHRLRGRAAVDARHHEVLGDGAPVRMGEEKHGYLDQADGDEGEHGPLPLLEASGRHDGHQGHGRRRHRYVGRDPGVGARQRYADELGDDGQEVEEKKVPDAEPAPAASEPLVDEPGVAHAGHGSEPDNHLLVDDQDGDEEQQCPQQRGVIVLPGLGVGGDTAGVVVADHDDDARPDDGCQGQQALLPRVALPDLADRDAPEGAFDVAEVRLVEHGGGPGLELAVGGGAGAGESAASEPSPLAVIRSVTGYPLRSEGTGPDPCSSRSAGGASGWGEVLVVSSRRGW